MMMMMMIIIIQPEWGSTTSQSGKFGEGGDNLFGISEYGVLCLVLTPLITT